jgi:hypothetical protein
MVTTKGDDSSGFVSVTNDSTTIELLAALKRDLSSFDTAGNVSGSTNSAKYKNDIAIVSTILQRFLDPDSVARMQSLISGVRDSNANTPLPTFNVRTPFVYVAINGIDIYPYDNISSVGGGIIADNSSPEKLFFQSLDINYPMGGQETTIRGTLKLFAKDPGPIINALTVTTSQNASDNLPIITLQWGWKFATSTGIQEIKTPKLDFISLNVDFTNFDTTGTEFTISLQEIGNTVCQYSSFPGLALESDYPQEQIRTLLERMLGMRLFTLDDLLYVKDGSVNDRTFFVTEKTAPIRFGSNNFSVILDELASRCRCRWYSHKNSELANVISEVSQQNTAYVKAWQELEQLKTKYTNDSPQIAEQKQKIADLQTLLASSCKLYWIPNVPKSLSTTGNLPKDSLQETGAFFLLPDLSDIHGDPQFANLVYGPGASSFPYLHGSAMNVFNASIATSEQHSQTFGDVLSVSVKYSNLVELLKESVSETAMYANEGNYMTTGTNGKISTVTVKQQYSGADVDEVYDNAMAQKKASAPTNLASSNNLTKNSFRFKNASRANNCLVLCDDISNRNIMGKNRTHYNTENSSSFTELKIRSRINNFLKRPLSLSIVVLGDPTLLRLGVGNFELISYYPDITGKTHNLNALLSGVFLVQQITHSISLNDYTTTIYGLKHATSSGLMATVSNEVVEEVQKDSTHSTTAQASDKITQQYTNVDLTSTEFLNGNLSQSLRQLLNNYEKQNGINK